MPASTPIVVYGAGGHARSVIEAIEAEGRWRIVGLVDEDPGRVGDHVLGYEVLGTPDLLPALRSDGVSGGFPALGNNEHRLRAARELCAAELDLVDVVHPTALVMKHAAVGAGSFLYAYSVVGPECRLGHAAIVSAHVTVGHQSHLGDAVHLEPGARVGGGCRIGDRCTFGTGAVVYARTTIGHDVQVWANAVVTRDAPDGAALSGLPARVVARADHGQREGV